MSLDCGRACSIILEDNYGVAPKAIGETLFPTSWKTLKSIVAETKLPLQEVTDGLALMIKYHFVVFRVSTVGRKSVVEYSLQYNEVLWTVRFPKYIQFMKSKYGVLGEFITCSVVTGGSQSATEIVLDCLNYPDATKDPEEILRTLREMIAQKYFIRLPMVAGDSAVSHKSNKWSPAPYFVNDDDLSFYLPQINLSAIAAGLPENAEDKDILWRVNSGRFHQEFRDNIVVEAVKNKLGTVLAECVAAILKMVYELDGGWVKDVSSPFSRNNFEAYLAGNTTNEDLIKYANHYLTLLVTDSLGVIRNMNSSSNELFVVDWARIFLNLTATTLEELVGQRFGAKARRIFCIVRSKPFIEQSELHKDVMMSDKECKSATYSLIKEHFIHIRSVRRVGASGAGHSGISYLFHLKTTKLVQTLMNTCYKAICNHILRTAAEKRQNHIVMDKIMKVKKLTQMSGQNNVSETAIQQATNIITAVDETHLAKVQNSIIIMLSTIQDVDDTIFQFEMYLYHAAKVQLVKPCSQFNAV